MDAADAAEQIAAYLAEGAPDLASLWVQRPEVILMPFQRSTTESFPVINVCLRWEDLTLNTLWKVSIQLARRLKDARLLDGLRAVEVVVCVAADHPNVERVLKFGATIDALDDPRWREPANLTTMPETFPVFCHWYMEPDAVAG